MAHGERERFQGTPTAVATRVSFVSATVITLAATNLARDRLTVLPIAGSVYLGYGNAAPTSTLDFGPVPAAGWSDEYYVGPVYGTVASGASAVAGVLEVGGGESG